MNHKYFSLIYLCVLGGLCFFAFGCGPKYPPGMPKLYPVKLTFTQEGKPLELASVMLYPEDSGMTWGVGGSTDNSGVVTLKTHGEFNGAPAGKYKVCVRKFLMEGELPTLANPGAPPPVDYELVDQQYKQPNTTPLTIEIKAGSNSFEPFDLGEAIKERVKKPGA